MSDKFQEVQILKSTGDDEGDEFEEFPIHDSSLNENSEEQTDVNVWQDNWDDETTETDFSKQLRDELKKHNFISSSEATTAVNADVNME